MKRTLILSAVLALITSVSVYADEGKGKPPGGGPGRHGDMGLLPSRLVEDLALTADQKTKYAEIETNFKAAAKKYRDEHPISDADREAMRKARESGDKEAMAKYREQGKGFMEIRKTYVDQVRATLTPDQVKKLDDAREKFSEHRKRGEAAK